MPKLRTIIYEDEASDFIDSETKNYPRLSQLIAAWEWRLSRDPDSGYLFSSISNGSDSDYYIIKTSSLFSNNDHKIIPIVPTIRIIYSYDNKEVNVFAISLA